jgi:hypothetical protein
VATVSFFTKFSKTTVATPKEATIFAPAQPETTGSKKYFATHYCQRPTQRGMPFPVAVPLAGRGHENQ